MWQQLCEAREQQTIMRPAAGNDQPMDLCLGKKINLFNALTIERAVSSVVVRG
jgi:hypothetical protein